MRTRRIAILIFDDFEPIDVWGFTEAFTIARFLGQGYSDPPPFPFEVVFVAAEKRPIRSCNGPKAMPDYDLAEAFRESLDVLMVPGGLGTRTIINDPKLLDWLVAMDKRVAIMASVCTGAALLAKAGLLDGRPAATNHAAFGWVVKQGPAVLWDSVSRWVDATSPRPASPPAPTWVSISSPASADAPWPRTRRAGRNTTGTATRKSRFNIRSKRRCEGSPIRYGQPAAARRSTESATTASAAISTAEVPPESAGTGGGACVTTSGCCERSSGGPVSKLKTAGTGPKTARCGTSTVGGPTTHPTKNTSVRTTEPLTSVELVFVQPPGIVNVAWI